MARRQSSDAYLLLGRIVPRQILRRGKENDKQTNRRADEKTHQTDRLVCDSEIQAHTSCFCADKDDPNRILGACELGNRVIPIELGHATSVGEAFDTLRFEVFLNEFDKGDELREDDDLVRVIRAEPLIDQLAVTMRKVILAAVRGAKRYSAYLVFRIFADLQVTLVAPCNSREKLHTEG